MSSVKQPPRVRVSKTLASLRIMSSISVWLQETGGDREVKCHQSTLMTDQCQSTLIAHQCQLTLMTDQCQFFVGHQTSLSGSTIFLLIKSSFFFPFKMLSEFSTGNKNNFFINNTYLTNVVCVLCQSPVTSVWTDIGRQSREPQPQALPQAWHHNHISVVLVSWILSGCHPTCKSV